MDEKELLRTLRFRRRVVACAALLCVALFVIRPIVRNPLYERYIHWNPCLHNTILIDKILTAYEIVNDSCLTVRGTIEFTFLLYKPWGVVIHSNATVPSDDLELDPAESELNTPYAGEQAIYLASPEGRTRFEWSPHLDAYQDGFIRVTARSQDAVARGEAAILAIVLWDTEPVLSDASPVQMTSDEALRINTTRYPSNEEYIKYRAIIAWIRRLFWVVVGITIGILGSAIGLACDTWLRLRRCRTREEAESQLEQALTAGPGHGTQAGTPTKPGKSSSLAGQAQGTARGERTGGFAPNGFRYDAFISYRHQEPDRSFARDLFLRLESAGFTIAIDERDFNSGETFVSEMERCVRESRLTLSIVSPRYFESGNTQEEAAICNVLGLSERKRRLVPLIVEKVPMPVWMYGLVGIDFTDENPLVDPFDKLTRELTKKSVRIPVFEFVAKWRDKWRRHHKIDHDSHGSGT